MIKQYGKRILSFVLVLSMILSVMPTRVLAAEEHDHEGEDSVVFSGTTENAGTETSTTPTEAAIDLVARINAILEVYGITADMTDDQISKAINAQPWSVNKPNITEVAQIEDLANQVPDADAEYVLANADVETFVRFKDIFKPMFVVAMAAASGNHTPVAGVTVGVSGATDNSMSNGAITVTAKGSKGVFGIGASSKTATITVYNESSSKANLSFDWTATSVNELKIDNTVYSGSSGTFEKVLDAGESFVVTITTAKNNTVNKLVMNNFALEAVKESSKVTFQYDSNLGSITVAGTAVANGSQVDVPSAGVEVKATAQSGGVFVGWIDAETHVILSKATTFTLEPAADMTVQAVFTKTTPWFLVNGNSLYEGLPAALEAVKSVANKTIVLMNNGTLPAGDYTIPSGVILLIPFDAANTLYTSEPKSVDANGTPTAYRTLTMESGANITINGALSLSAKHSNKQLHNGRPIGAVSFINMKSNSKITVNSGGNLYVWGYITGEGSVEVKSGATVHENFQVMDWRGGSAGTGMIGNKQRVFLMSQYYIQNIEVPMTIHAGASEQAYMSVVLPLVGAKGAGVPFIGTDNCMFTISNGYIIKDYREGTGRLDIDVYGDVSVSNIKISMSVYTVKSADYELPINGNLSIDVHSGNINLNQNVAFQPGSELYVREGAVCNLGSGNSIYVYDQDDWGPFVFNDGSEYKELPYIPGGGGSEGRGKDALIQIDGTAVLNGTAYTTVAGANIVSNGNGVVVIGKIGTQTVTYQAKQADTTISYADIAVTPFKLKNTDGTYVDTGYTTGTYTYTDGVWVKTSCAHIFDEVITQAPTCTETGLKTQTCKDTVNCGLVNENVAVPAKGHTAGEGATCTTAQSCTVCGAELTAALGHEEVVDAGKAPTCTETGLTEGKHCSVCNAVTVKQEVIPAKGHTAGEDATCTTAQSCTVCGAELTAALGHEEVVDAAKAPTCTETGLTEGKHCSVCGETLVAQVTVPTTDHNYTKNVTEPTCTKPGYTTNVCHCGASYVDSEVDALGHSWVWITDKEATVLESGVKHEECSVCYEKRNENTEIPVLDCSHTGTMTGTEAKKATCTEAGNSAYWYCSACRNYYSDAAGQHEIEQGSWVIGALNHDKVSHEAKAPTCTEIGWDAYVTCKRCDYTTYAEQASLGHDEVSHEAKAPTCTEIGWDAYVTCSRCDYTTYVEIIAKGHGMLEEVAEVASTCQKEGIVAHWHCTDCGMNFADEAATKQLESVAAPIDPDNHTWAQTGEETKATCQAEGKVIYPCVNEGCEETKVETLPVDPEGHVWDEGEPYKIHSCNSASYMKYTCTLCKETKLVVVREQHFRIPIAEEIPATCTEDGMTSGWKCEKCDEFWIPQEVIPALGHDWNESFPCQSETSACTRCDLHFDTKQEHLVVIDPAVAATCTATGLTEGAHCGYCGEILVAQSEIPMAEHNWIVDELETPATCNSIGHKAGAKYCVDCDYDADPIPMLEHEWMHRDAKKATYSAIGWNAHDYCLLCNATKTLEQYEDHPCEFCGENPEGYIEIPKVEIQAIATLDEYLSNIGYLEMMAQQYALQHPGADPLGLVLNYLRTAVANYTTGSWAIMAGPEDKDFLKFVQDTEDAINSDPSIEVWVNVSGLKKIKNYKSPCGEKNLYNGKNLYIISGHFYGTMDMTYHNKGSQNHADVGGWVGDLTDLLSTTDEYGVPANLTMEEKIAYITKNYLFKEDVAGAAGSFGSVDLYADLDAFYIMNELITKGYNTGDLAKLLSEYYMSELTLKQRFEYLMNNRLDGLSIRQDLRTAVYNAYTSNKLIATLEGTRNFKASGNELTELRKAVCYAFADEMCRLAGDYVEDLNNPRFTVFDTETKILAPGVSQQISYATNADGKQIVYYVATADVKRDDVGLWVNYYDRDPGTPENPQWKNNSVPSSAQNAQDRYGDPNSPDYIENFNVIASTNAGGYDMSDTATPGGLVVMNGIEWYPQTNTAGFFAILSDGTAYMGTYDEYRSMMDAGLIQEAIGGFGEFVVMDGKVTGSATYSDAPRTSVGITSTGRVVIMCIDGRQAPFSSGASLQDVGYIMKEAGCVVAINLDGGGSTTFVARQPGEDELTIMNRPSDGYPRNVSTNLLIYSTAPSSTAFDHAVIESAYDYATINTPVQMTAAGVSPAGNAVDVPEGATWAVSNEEWASITEDGVFTGKRLGEVYVYLMLDGQTIGSKLMTLTNPDQVYFEKAKVDVIYGSSVNLPLRARCEGKSIAINPNDVTITLSAPAAGTMDGFTFKAAESTIKSVSITAAIGENTKASINVMLYQQGENSFDFDKATGGDRTLAWDRQVSNAKVEDGNIYNVIDPSKDMVTAYTFALDMTTIPIPERLEELTYMLPGGTIEGANAWSFLLSLAQRISDMSWVKATIDFDDRFDVDYSELKILNEYFELKGIEFDETTNTLTVTMHWIKQSQVIDEATANPLCLINGIKLTPKDSVWTDATKIDAVTSGTIGYEIYMRASGLYGFAQKPENQAVFGIYPYRNPADTADAGGYFRDTYADITDEYTLVNVLKEGWVNEDGGFAYYVEGERLTGIQLVDSLYYDFGESGINVGKTPYTGLFQIDGSNYYTKNGEFVKGWQTVGNDWYLFSWQTGKAEDGTYRTTIEGVTVTYELDNGRLTKGYWHESEKGIQYFYGPYLYKQGLKEIDGKQYIFEEYYVCTGIRPVKLAHANMWYEFTDKGVVVGYAKDGLHWYQGGLYYVVDASSKHTGFYEIDGAYYYFQSNYQAVVDGVKWVSNTNNLLPAGTYRFDEAGKVIMTTEIVNENGTLYYYRDGMRINNAGLVQVNGDYYCIGSGGVAYVDQDAWVADSNNYGFAYGYYRFGADGKLVDYTGLIDNDGTLYYYLNGRQTRKAGLIKFEDAYYYIDDLARAVTNTSVWISTNAAHGLWPQGTYEFGADGKMIIYNGVVNGYYYVEGIKTAAGLVEQDGYYYFAGSGGKLVTSQSYWVSKHNGLVTTGTYRFDAEGKMIMTTEIVNENGTLYYYRDGMRINNAGLVQFNGDYYCIGSGAIAYVDQDAWVADSNNYGFAYGYYRFGADGKLVDYTGLIDNDGTLYYYLNGRQTRKAGLIKFEDAYYYIDDLARAVTNTSVWISTNAAHGLKPQGTYEFGADGKMIIYHGVANGYYYVEGIKTAAGLVEQDGYYYFAGSGGKLVTSQSYWVSKHNGLVTTGTYRFDAEGRMIMTTEIVNENGTLYYYRDGMRINNAGLVQFNGDYYCIGSGAIAAVNQEMWIGASNAFGFVSGYYLFGEDGKLSTFTGVRETDGVLYYYKDGKRTKNAGLIEFEGAYYHVGDLGKITVNATVWISTNAAHGLWPQGTYDFGADGKMIIYHGVANGYYYVEGIKTAAGLVEQDGYYYFAGSGGKLVTSQSYWVSKHNGLVTTGTYRFDAEGKMIMTTEIVNENGTLYYYRDGMRINNAGLVQFNGDYYCIGSGAIAAVNQEMWIGASNAFGFVSGYYLFGEDGKLSTFTGVRETDGVLYYYKDGKRTKNAGLIEFEGAYYHVGDLGKITVNATVWISTNAAHGLKPQGSYTFGADGKMI